MQAGPTHTELDVSVWSHQHWVDDDDDDVRGLRAGDGGCQQILLALPVCVCLDSNVISPTGQWSYTMASFCFCLVYVFNRQWIHTPELPLVGGLDFQGYSHQYSLHFIPAM